MANDLSLSRDVTPANATVNTRKGGQMAKTQQHKVKCRCPWRKRSCFFGDYKVDRPLP